MNRVVLIVMILCAGIVAFLFVNRPVDSPVIEVEPSQDLRSRLVELGYEEGYPEQILIAAFKEEQILEVYAVKDRGFKLIKKYPFTAFSGVVGPKLKEGDRQIPEGVYKIEYLNPNSSYHLSVKVSYPNAFDIEKSELPTVEAMGGDIFIHGKAVTIGCIPLGDAAIEEVYLLTEKAFAKEVKVIIAPRDFRVNPDYPEVDFVDWEGELYDSIVEELNQISFDHA